MISFPPVYIFPVLLFIPSWWCLSLCQNTIWRHFLGTSQDDADTFYSFFFSPFTSYSTQNEHLTIRSFWKWNNACPRIQSFNHSFLFSWLGCDPPEKKKKKKKKAKRNPYCFSLLPFHVHASIWTFPNHFPIKLLFSLFPFVPKCVYLYVSVLFEYSGHRNSV